MVMVSLITSLYRSEAFLPDYAKAVRSVLYALFQAGVSAELVLIANDATDTERGYITALDHDLHGIASVQTHYVGRETLYASWNRGLSVFRGEACGFWNVDDIHTAEGYLDGLKRLKTGATLVDFPYERVVHLPNGRTRRTPESVRYTPEYHSRKSLFSPFALFSRMLIEQVGAFDERFRIAGDLDYSVRTLGKAQFAKSDVFGGEFHLHGGNLSSNNNPRQLAENNVIFLQSHQFKELLPVDPDLMREMWHFWEHTPEELPQSVQAWLWGRGAETRARYYALLWRYPLLYRIHASLSHRKFIPNWLLPPN